MIPVYKCKKCRWIGKDTIFVDGDTECCPRCHDVNFMELVSLEKKSTFTSDDLKVLWQLFQEDVPVKEEMFMHFTGWQFKEYLEKCVKVMRYYQKDI